MSDEEIERAVKEAEQFAEEDRKRKEAIDAKNEADSLIFQTEKTLGENPGGGRKNNSDRGGEERTSEGRNRIDGSYGSQNAVLQYTDILQGTGRDSGELVPPSAVCKRAGLLLRQSCFVSKVPRRHALIFLEEANDADLSRIAKMLGDLIDRHIGSEYELFGIFQLGF